MSDSTLDQQPPGPDEWDQQVTGKEYLEWSRLQDSIGNDICPNCEQDTLRNEQGPVWSCFLCGWVEIGLVDQCEVEYDEGDAELE